MRRTLLVCACALPLLAGTPAGAAGLLQAWQAAQRSDPEYAAAIAAHQAGATKRAQADALWRPNVQLSAAAGRGSGDTSVAGARFSAPGFGSATGAGFDTSVSDGNLRRWTLSARQPIYNRERQAQARQLNLAGDVADLEWQHARQALMLRVAEKFFDAMLAAESLRLARRQQEAVERTLKEVRDRFELGDVKITDTHEASARAEAVKAQALAAETELELKRAALADLTGLAPSELPMPALLRDAPPFDLARLDTWLDKARLQNPQVRMQDAAHLVAREEAVKHSALAAPTLDLVAQTGRERLRGSGDFGPSSSSGGNSMVGLQLTVPLYTGGWRSARRAEAVHLADREEAEAGRARQRIALQTRAAWLDLSAGEARLKALAAAAKASQARLDATRLGSELGDRTTLDLLNAENDAAAAELALLQARIGTLLNRLRLWALAGELDEPHLQTLDTALATPQTK